MAQITDIQPQKKTPNRVNIFIDHEFAFGISLESKIINKLKINEEISSEKATKLIFDDQVERLTEKALRFLSYRPRSEREIRTNLTQKLKLTDKGEDEKKSIEASVEEVIKKLQKINQVNDLEFAQWWFDQRVNFKKTSLRVIKGELFAKGIDKEIIEEITKESGVDDFSSALKLAEKKEAGLRKYEPKDFKIRLGRFLASKGYDWETTKAVVDTLLEKR